MTDDNIAILYEANKEVNVEVNTPNSNGLAVREKIILQEDECSVTVDSFDKYLYLYKDCVKIPILSMTDDALLISVCGYKT